MRKQRLARWWPSLIVLLSACIGDSLLHGSVLTLAYLHEGFTVEQARHVIPIRGRTDELGGLLVPVMILLTVTPFTSLLPSTRQAAAASVAIATLGVLMVIALELT